MTPRLLTLALLLAAAGCGPPTFAIGEPFAIVHFQPNTDEDAAVDVLPEVSFNRAVDLTTAGSAVTLVAADADVEMTLSPREDGKTLRLIPRRALPFDTDVTLTVGAQIESDDHVNLETDFVLPFHTLPGNG